MQRCGIEKGGHLLLRKKQRHADARETSPFALAIHFYTGVGAVSIRAVLARKVDSSLHTVESWSSSLPTLEVFAQPEVIANRNDLGTSGGDKEKNNNALLFPHKKFSKRAQQGVVIANGKSNSKRPRDRKG